MSSNVTGVPVQQYLVRDRRIRGAASSTSELGERVGLVAPAAENFGGLVPTVTGDPDAGTDATLDLRLTDGGDVGTSRWGWRGADGAWRGAHYGLYLWGHHPPSSAQSQGAVVVYSTVHRRVLVISVDTGTAVKTVYSDVNARPMTSSEWTVAGSFAPADGVSQFDHALAACELRDGTLLLLVRRPAAGPSPDIPSEGDFDLYRSSDVGATWTRTVRGVFRQCGLQATDLEEKFTPRMAASGDWVRIVTVGDGGHLLTLVSSDAGASWAYSSLLSAGIDVDLDLSASQANDIQPFAIVAVDDATGAFLLFANPAASGDTHKVGAWYATRTEEWSEQDALLGDPTVLSTPRAYAAWADPAHVWLLVYAGAASGGNDGWYFFRAPRDSVLTASAWEGEGFPLPIDIRAAARLAPIQVTAAWCDDRAAVCGYLQDMEESTPVSRKAARPWLAWVGGWSARPWSSDFVAAEYAEALHWSAIHGEPANGGTSSSDTEWTGTLTGAGTHSWSNGVYVETDGNAAAAVAKFTWDTGTADPKAPPQWDPPSTSTTLYQQARRWVGEWVAAVGLTSPLGTIAPVNAVKFEVPSTGGGGFGWQFAVQMAPSQAVVYNSMSPVSTVTGLDLDTAEQDVYHRFRLAVAPATSPANPVGVLMVRDEDGDTWTVGATFSVPLATSLGITQHAVEFGLIAAPVGTATTILARWRELRVTGIDFEVDYPRFDPDDWLPGAPTAVRPWGVAAGATDTDPSRLRVAWGGAGGAAGDTWGHELAHDYPAAAVAVDSPQVKWRSAAGATAGTQVVLDACGAGATVDDGARWTINAVACFGLENCAVTVYGAASPSATLLVALGTLDATQYTGVRVTSVAGRHVTLQEPTTGGWREGDLTGRYLTISSAATGSAGGHVHRIARHLTSSVVELDPDGQFDATELGAGDTVAIWSANALLTFSTTSVRCVVLSFGSVGQNNWDGSWACGTVVPGVIRTFDPPLGWVHTDEDEPFVVENRTRGGQSWAYEEAPPARRVTMRWVGDNAGARQGFRDAMRYLAKYGEEPTALLLNREHPQDQDRSLLLTRFDGPVDLDNQFWSRVDGAGANQARAGGDLGLTFREIT